MTRPFTATTAAAFLLAAPSLALEPVTGAEIGTTASEVEENLEAEGYLMTDYSRSETLIRVSATKDGTTQAIRVEPNSGRVIAVQAQAARPVPHKAQGMDQDLLGALAAEGYEVVGFEREHNELEVYATQGGQLWELKIDPVSGKVLSREPES